MRHKPIIARAIADSDVMFIIALFSVVSEASRNDAWRPQLLVATEAGKASLAPLSASLGVGARSIP